MSSSAPNCNIAFYLFDSVTTIPVIATKQFKYDSLDAPYNALQTILHYEALQPYIPVPKDPASSE